ncbi:MAG: penicillin-binding transpeptidase domain-containing protein [Thermomicrobiales bacterium]
MARSPYAAPYAARRRPPRWPWFAGATVLVALIAFAGVAASTGPFTDQDIATDQIAQQQGASAELAGGETPSTPTEPPAPTGGSEGTATPDDDEAPARLAEMWFSLWADDDFFRMYQLTSDTTRTVVSEAEFIERYQGIQTMAGIKSLSAGIAGEMTPDGRMPFTVTYESTLVGDLTQQNGMMLVEQGDEWRVNWTPALIFREIGDTGCVAWQGEPLQRGRILDRDGVVLAEDAEVSQVGVMPGQLADEDATINALGQIIDMDPDEIRATYQRDGVDPGWFVPVKNLPADRGIELLNQVQGMEGVIVKSGFGRTYPHGPLFAHVTGYVSPATAEDVAADETGSVQPDQTVGRSGLEYGANEILAGKPGGSLSVVECDTRAVREVIAEAPGVPPLDITITIDLEFQQQVDAAVGNIEQLKSVPNADPESPFDDLIDEESEQSRGAAVVLDPQTGAVLAMVSHPTFDPNGFVTGTGGFDDEELARLNDPVLRPQANRATIESYPAGSIFKLITASAAMADLGYTGDTPVNCPASFSIGDNVWNDWVVENGLSAQGQLTLHSGLVRSCNTVFYQIGADLDIEGPNLLPDMAKAYGLGAPTGIPYFPEAGGVVPDPEWKLENIEDGWATGDNVNLSIGQGYLLVTPLQMANAYASVANGGEVLQPYIVDRAQMTGTDIVQQIGEREVVRELPLTDTQIAELQSALRDQTSNDNNVGSSRIFGDMTWPISGKTGTAQNGPQDGSVPPHSWFAAYGPADGEATIASAVMFEQVGEGVQYAAPVTRAIYDDWIASQGVASTP